MGPPIFLFLDGFFRIQLPVEFFSTRINVSDTSTLYSTAQAEAAGFRVSPLSVISAGVRRGYAHAVKFIVKVLEKAQMGQGWRVCISHANAMDKARQTLKALQSAMPEAMYEILPLSPAFTTQGGPGCVAVQYIQA